jgi:glycosyltransferase involved in cell wall biosynthesis
MRIAIATHSGRVVGGIESYLTVLIPALVAADHEVALWYEQEGGDDRPPVAEGATTGRWDASRLPGDSAIQAIGQWKPDVILSNGLADPDAERSLFNVAPSVLFAHAYYGACISGWKSRLSPTRAPCTRTLGVPCLLHYLPRRCGGLNPATMLELYRLETRRRDLLRAFHSVITASAHMRREYERHGVPGSRLHVVDLPLPPDVLDDTGDVSSVPGSRGERSRSGEAPWKLAFMARLSELKGGALLLDALPHVRRLTGASIMLTIIGDGSERGALERRARQITGRDSNVRIEFTGWLQGDTRRARLREADLLVVPSVWPEPFGLVGPEAGMLGIPAAAFDVGGIRAWLEEGVNGHLAPGHRPRARDLAAAIARCLTDPAHHARLRRGAMRVASRFTMRHHLAQLVPILDAAANRLSTAVAE